MNNKKLTRVLSWLDTNILILLSSVLLILIPLYPKLPLFDIIPGYLVRVRIEDFAVLLTLGIWMTQVLRKKIAWKTPLTIPIALYAVVGLLSVISAVVFTHTVPAQLLHIGKTSLHFFRYLEYFSIYFILVSAIKTKEHFKIIISVIAVTLICITFYGIGQKYWYWPVYSTMNREFAKGIRLVLTEHARVQSTFGGHYDLGGYLVIVLPLILSLIAVTKKYWRLLLVTSYLGGVWLIFVSSSRSSIGGYLVACGIVILWQALRNNTWRKKFSSFATMSLIFVLVHAFFLRNFGDDLFQRVEQTINSFPVIAKPYTASTTFIDHQWEFVYESGKKTIDGFFKRGASDDLANAFKVEKPINAVSIDQVLVASDTRPEPARPSDVYIEIPVYTQVATTSADGTTTYSTVETPRDYSENAIAKGLSLAIRLDTLWPRALAGFYINPLLGSGYATLTKESIGQFTEAESTDNNFLRTIGETGALGFVSFYGVAVLAIVRAWQLAKKKSLPVLEKGFAIGFIASSIGLFINAGAIDVFAASKVAFYYWAVTGILFALTMIRPVSTIEKSIEKPVVKRRKTKQK
ncbi:O-antigen ligase family protein [Candidatus Woesebacteria bacterium]|nr:O-antigen ligase family protein [Candidatus Woesebacteria bacterium]